MRGLAGDLARAGWAVWNIEYRRLGRTRLGRPGGGGWPATFEDVAAAVDRLAGLDAPLDLAPRGRPRPLGRRPARPLGSRPLPAPGREPGRRAARAPRRGDLAGRRRRPERLARGGAARVRRCADGRIAGRGPRPLRGSPTRSGRSRSACRSCSSTGSTTRPCRSSAAGPMRPPRALAGAPVDPRRDPRRGRPPPGAHRPGGPRLRGGDDLARARSSRPAAPARGIEKPRRGRGFSVAGL